jgi:hypothetical protein
LVLYAYVCVCAFLFRRESTNMILGDKPRGGSGTPFKQEKTRPRNVVVCRYLVRLHAPRRAPKQKTIDGRAVGARHVFSFWRRSGSPSCLIRSTGVTAHQHQPGHALFGVLLCRDTLLAAHRSALAWLRLPGRGFFYVRQRRQ